ncbi:MAG: hypothetical protein DMG36_23025 [Acidobacteria bacterium]|nr:MAG: hypothetical protein DMG36_23025 [Acidobacteriota bacterium]
MRLRTHDRVLQRAALVQPLADELRVDARCQHQAEVTQDGQAAKLSLAPEPLEVLVLVLPCGQSNLPGIGRFERVLNEFLPGRSLRSKRASRPQPLRFAPERSLVSK